MIIHRKYGARAQKKSYMPPTVCVRDCDVHKQRNRTAIFFLFFCFVRTTFSKFTKNLRPKPICRHVFVFPGKRSCFLAHTFHFAGACFSLCKGHDHRHTQYYIIHCVSLTFELRPKQIRQNRFKNYCSFFKRGQK